ncbi:hypothetical protein BC830DRAFT_1132428 [Chytriomyces sp. MP71]|nr:hypothetical protein BC830DRAFT_1132428 [Chytriomyces sp. MP71]
MARKGTAALLFLLWHGLATYTYQDMMEVSLIGSWERIRWNWQSTIDFQGELGAVRSGIAHSKLNFPSRSNRC